MITINTVRIGERSIELKRIYLLHDIDNKPTHLMMINRVVNGKVYYQFTIDLNIEKFHTNKCTEWEYECDDSFWNGSLAGKYFIVDSNLEECLDNTF